jgi:prepilin-type N-terminal cleavage/methylation domain-containing protein
MDTTKSQSHETGFTLLETAIAMVLLAVVALGVASLFAYAASATTSANDREMACAVAQQEMEQLRSVQFNDASLAATSGTANMVTRLGRTYRVVTVITDGALVNGNATLKTISVSVTSVGSQAKSERDATSLYASVILVTERSAQRMGPNRVF